MAAIAFDAHCTVAAMCQTLTKLGVRRKGRGEEEGRWGGEGNGEERSGEKAVLRWGFGSISGSRFQV